MSDCLTISARTRTAVLNYLQNSPLVQLRQQHGFNVRHDRFSNFYMRATLNDPIRAT